MEVCANFYLLHSLQIEVLKSHSKPHPIPIDALDIDYYDLNFEKNQTAHFTDAYEYSGLVVRRGKSFSITITTTKPFPKGALSCCQHALKAASQHAAKPSTSNIFPIQSVVCVDTSS